MFSVNTHTHTPVTQPIHTFTRIYTHIHINVYKGEGVLLAHLSLLLGAGQALGVEGVRLALLAAREKGEDGRDGEGGKVGGKEGRRGGLLLPSNVSGLLQVCVCFFVCVFVNSSICMHVFMFACLSVCSLHLTIY